MDLAPRHNAVPWEPPGLTIAVQYWREDEAAALRLARLLADIEPAHRDDVSLLFCRRAMDLSPAAWETMVYCGAKFSVSHMVVAGPEGHPDGPNALWAGVMEWTARAWAAGAMRQPAVFFIEPDGCPLRSDWISLLVAEHETSLLAGKRVTGALMRLPVPHFNGTLICDASVWPDRPSLHATPPGEAWDIHHAAALLQEGRATSLIRNIYGLAEASPSVLAALAGEVAWLASAKDASVVEWAERTLASS